MWRGDRSQWQTRWRLTWHWHWHWKWYLQNTLALALTPKFVIAHVCYVMTYNLFWNRNICHFFVIKVNLYRQECLFRLRTSSFDVKDFLEKQQELIIISLEIRRNNCTAVCGDINKDNPALHVCLFWAQYYCHLIMISYFRPHYNCF